MSRSPKNPRAPWWATLGCRCAAIFLVFGIVIWVGTQIMLTINHDPPRRSQ